MRVAVFADRRSLGCWRWWILVVSLIATLGQSTTQAQQVPEGFKAELLYSAPEIEHPSVVTCDDEGNLFVGEDPMDMRGPATEEFDRVLLIKFDADGRPVRKTVFCDKLSAVFGLCWLDGALYVMHAPHYTMFRDTDGDGVADERKDLADGFGPAAGIFGFNDHIVSGIRLGLDGYLYISVGDKGIQKATGSDGSSITLEGGGVVRMFPNGTRLEVVTSGTRNHLDVAMDSLDNIFTYDNTDDGLGWWTRFTHQIPTGYYGYPYDYHPHPDRHLPRISEHGGGSPVGADVYREAAWPEKYRDSPFHCEWGKRKIQRFALTKRGASFDAKIEDFMTPEEGSEFRPQDLCFSPDGKFMYVADWNFGGWTKPDRVGRLYRVSYVGNDVAAEPPRAVASDSRKRQLESLGHPAYSERVRAQQFLAKSDAPTGMLQILRTPGNSKAKVHALWAFYHKSLPPAEAVHIDPFFVALADADPDVRGQAARAIGELYAIRKTAPNSAARGPWDAALLKALADPDPSVRLRAAIAVGQTRSDSPRELYTALADEDVHVRFAVVQALRRIGDWRLAAEQLNSQDERIRSGVLLALTGQYTDPAVAALAAASKEAREPAVRSAAISALAEVHQQADPYTTGWWGTQPARSQPARPKRNSWSGTATIVAAIRDCLGQQDPIVQTAAVQAVRDTQDAASVEAVRKLLTADGQSDNVVAAAIATLSALKDTSCESACVQIAGDSKRAETLRQAAIETLGILQLDSSIVPLVSLVADDATPTGVMAKCFSALAALKGDAAREALSKRLASGPAPLRVQAIEVFAELAGAEGGNTLALQLGDTEPAVREATVRALGKIGHRESVPALIALTGDPAYRFVSIGALARMPDSRALGAYLEGLADKSPELRDESRRALAAIRDKIGDDLVELDRRQELSAVARSELKAIYADPIMVRDWQMAGAWPKEHRPEFDPSVPPQLDQKIEAGGTARKWRKLTLPPDKDRFNLLGNMKPTDNAWCVGYAAIESERAESSELQLGSDDQLAVWLNGAQVYEHRDSRGWSADSARVPVELKPGTNHLWVLAGNDGGPWEFSVRLRRDDPKFAFLAAALPDRPGPDAYREFALRHSGDAVRGRKLFEDKQGVGCIKCHAIGGKGATIGPDLLSVGTKYPRDELIRSVLEPSNRILSGYQVTIVITDDGRTHQGIIKRETPESVELVDAEGKTTALPIDTIVERETANVSMMPNGLKDGLTLEDFADVVGYLESLKETAAGN